MNTVDRFICEVDAGLKTLFAKVHAERPLPKPLKSESAIVVPLEENEKAESIRLMRVNHCGEVCAQALYQGQAMVTKDKSVQQLLTAASNEERDHLAWCESRLTELGGKRSYLSPLFYAGSFGLGVVSGLMGDKWSLGFLVETEKQVEAHLHDHLSRLSAADAGSRAILETMREDEIRHGQSGIDHGGESLPQPVKLAMQGFSKLMTRTTYWV
ncbi:MAG: 2-polyprenyl-3-methyl-6-methoxy-1,4-benzoquinone monooxygenase [Betaproteobacteria bacterium]